MKKLLMVLLLAIAPALGAQIGVKSPQDAYDDSLQIAYRIATDSLMLDSTAVVLDTSVPDPRFLQMDDHVRDFLASEWRKYARDPYSSERGYCLTYQLDWGWNDEMAYRITNITLPDTTVGSSTAHIVFNCPIGPFRAELHVHPPSTCTAESHYCWLGGTDAYECFPSDQDVLHLSVWLVDQPFAAIQCDEHAVVYWKPDRRMRKAGILARRIIDRWRTAKARP